MEKQEIRDDRQHKRRGTNIGGLALAIVGLYLLMQNLDLDIPHWIVSWPSMLILIGILVGVRYNFRNISWLVLIAVGSVFLFQEISPNLIHIKEELVWPIILIVVGLVIYTRHAFGPVGNDCDPWRKRWERKYQDKFGAPPVPPHVPPFGGDNAYRKENYGQQSATDNDYLNASAIFSGTQKIVLSKNFQGGSLSAMFGGLEVNMMQADIVGTAVLNVSTLCGGMEIIVPGNWTVRLEETTLFGGSEDSRPASLLAPDPNKVLVIRGSVLFGGLEIKSY